MAKLSPETKQRINTIVSVSKTAVRYGFVPLVLYLGMKQGSEEGMPPITLSSLLFW